MKNKKAVIFLMLAIIIFGASAFTVLHTSGYAYASGSPYDGSSCALCHGGGPTTPTVIVNANPAFGSGNTYSPGSTYTLDVVVSGAYPKYGFNTEILDSNNPNVVNDAGICGPPVSANVSKIPASGGNPTNYTHNFPIGSAGSTTFSFQWTAPASGPVYIYTSGLGVNFTSTSGGDKVATYSVILGPTVGIATHSESEIDFKIFPNPATDKVRLSFFAQEKSFVSVKLYALNGQLIAELLNTICAHGPQISDINLPSDLSRGMYFVRIKMNDHEISKRLVLH